MRNAVGARDHRGGGGYFPACHTDQRTRHCRTITDTLRVGFCCTDSGSMLLVAFLASTAFACGGSSSQTTATSTPSAPTTTTALAVTGTTPAIGETIQFTATATRSDGATANVTLQAAWQSSTTAVATVSASGLVTGVGPGEADITATYQQISGSRRVKVEPSPRTFTVSGTITDESTGRPIDAEVEVIDGANVGQKTHADVDGRYSLAGVAAGSFTLRARATNYESTDNRVTISNADARVDIRLQLACSYTVAPLRFSVSSGGLFGGTATLEKIYVTTSRLACQWTASSNGFILLQTGPNQWGSALSGTGTTAVSIGSNAYAGGGLAPPRTCTIRFTWPGGGIDVIACQPNCLVP
jgi:Carboxypeptidase regulatory-like domain/Bacterial Ig-like domain (group 2)